MKYCIIIILWLPMIFSQVQKYIDSYHHVSHTVHIIKPDQWSIYQQQQKKIRVVVIIDVFRACTTAAYILNSNPKTYILASKSYIIQRLASNVEHPLLVGKPEKGSDLVYHIPNSPTRTKDVMVSGRHVLHRTEAGANGILLAGQSDILLAAGFINASATAQYIKNMKNVEVIIIPMGHEGMSPSLEDNLCATYLKELIGGRKLKIGKFIPILQEGAGKYFFSTDQYQYPEKDFFRCLKIDRFNFVIQAKVIADYAVLTRVH